MSFWDKYVQLCSSIDKYPNTVAEEIGISSGTVTHWKAKNATPRSTTILKIANYFDVPVEYFSEKTEKSPAPGTGTEDIMKIYDMLTPERKQKFLDSMTALLKEQLQG